MENDNFSSIPKMVRMLTTNLDSSKASSGCVSLLVLKNCEYGFSYISGDLFNIYLKKSCFWDCFKVLFVALCLRKLGKVIWLKTTVLLVISLGHTALLLYISDLSDDIVCNIVICVDDTSIYYKCDQASDFRGVPHPIFFFTPSHQSWCPPWGTDCLKMKPLPHWKVKSPSRNDS